MNVFFKIKGKKEYIKAPSTLMTTIVDMFADINVTLQASTFKEWDENVHYGHAWQFDDIVDVEEYIKDFKRVTNET